jgi:predicted Zn-dependent peptidase
VSAGTEHRLTELDSGLRVITERMPSVRSVALGWWVGAGSRAEAPDQAGLSHLIEHLLFRGSRRYGSLEIDQLFDAMGAEINAATGKEATSLYCRMLDGHTERALDATGDMVFAPALADVDAEREIILEEIASYEDDPQDKIFDVLGAAVFGDGPLGRPVIGRAEVVAGAPPAAIAAFHAAGYRPANVVLAAAGSVEHDRLVELAAELMATERAPQADPADAGPAAPLAAGATAGPGDRVRFERKDTEQYHVCLGGPGLARDDERRFALRLLDAVLGATPSSRLFQAVRERRGLAYAVQSFSEQYADVGEIGLYLGTRADNLAAALRVVSDELHRFLEDPATSEELERVKENAKGRLVLALESTMARMSRLGSALLTGMPLLSVEEMIARIDAVSHDDLVALARELLDPARLHAAGIGPDEEAFRAALSAVDGALLA